MANQSNKRVKALPYDENGKPLAGLVLPLIDGSGNITGWVPIGAVDQGDGSYALKVNADLTVESADIDIGDIHLLDLTNNKINPATKEAVDALEAILNGQLKIASSNGQASANKFIEVDSDGRVKVTAGGTVSTNNSTTTPLGASGQFLGTAESSLPWSHVIIMVRADQPSAANGLCFEVSHDGGSTFTVLEEFKVPANKTKIYTLGPAGTHFRVKYINGAVAQTSFFLNVTLKPFFQKASTHRIIDDLVDEDDAELVKSVLSGQASTGIFKNVKVTDDGSLLVSVDPGSAPPDTTPVVRTVIGSVSGTVDDAYVIPNGQELTIQTLNAGAQDGLGGSKVTLFEDPNGDLSVLNRISTLYVNASSSSVTIGEKFTGNGTRRIVLRRIAFGGSAREIFGQWKGFLV